MNTLQTIASQAQPTNGWDVAIVAIFVIGILGFTAILAWTSKKD